MKLAFEEESMQQSKNERFSELERRINDYFLYCDAHNEGKKNIEKPYTLSGLLCYTGLSRNEFQKISKIKRHEPIFRAALAKIEAFIEENMLTGALSCNASLNSLKYNFDWGEKSGDSDGNNDGRHITVTLSPEMRELAR